MSEKRIRHVDLAALFFLGIGFRLVLLLFLPVPYGNDGFGRLFFRDQLFLSHWLPLTQAIVVTLGWMADDIFWTRLAFAVFGALAGCSFYVFLRTLVGRQAALIGGVLFSLNVLYVQLSLMPYQDVVFLGLFYAALAHLGPRLQAPLSAFFVGLWGLAALTRYESWFILPVLVVWRTWSGPASARERAGRLALNTLAFGWGPLAWFALSAWRWGDWNGFLFQGPQGQFYGWHPHLDLTWAATYAGRLAYWAVLFSSPLVALALVGVRRLWRHGSGGDDRVKMLLANGVLVLVFFFFVIGQEQETVFRFVGFPNSIALVLAAVGIDAALAWLYRTWPVTTQGWIRKSALGALALGLMMYAAIPMVRLTRMPEYQDPFRIARYLEAHLGADESALIVADRFRDFSDAAPMAYQRITAQARLPRARVLSAGTLGIDDPSALQIFARERRIRYVVVFSNFEPWQPADRFFSDIARARGGRPVLVTETAAVYRINAWPDASGR